MIIKEIETFPLLYPLPAPYGDANGLKKYRSCFLIKLTTESGIEGWGECVDWLPALNIGFEKRIKPFLKGQSATDRKQIIRVIRNWHPRSASAVSMALFEIIAKAAGLSVCDFMGGRQRSRIPVYASFQSYTEGPEWAKASLQHIEKNLNFGFSKVKLKIGGKSIQEDQAHIRDVQKHLHHKTEVILDANQSYDSAAVLEWRHLLLQWTNVLWFEEPMPMHRIAEYAILRNECPIPLAGGENLADGKDFVPLLTSQALQIIQPDPMHHESIDRYVETLRLARCFGMRVSPHTYDGALSRLYAIFAQAALEPWSKMEGDSIEPIEWDVMDNPFTRLIPVSPSNGVVEVPDGTGIGVQLDEELIRHYRWDGRSY